MAQPVSDDSDADTAPDNDQVIELVGGVPFIYPDTPDSEDTMRRIRGAA
jgi:hypothetical protein